MSRSLENPVIVWIIEDDSHYKSALLEALKNELDIRCTKTFWDFEGVLSLLNSKQDFQKPDVVLLDIKLPGMSGIEGIGHLKSQVSTSEIIMLTIVDKTDTIYEALRAGASGYLVKTASSDKIANAIREAAQGGMLMPQGVAEKVRGFFSEISNKNQYGLSRREKEVLQEMADGYSQKEIAARLFIDRTTVDSHIQNIYRKLHVHSGTQAVAKAIRERLVN